MKMYCDGGVIAINPSSLGGTFCALVMDENNNVVDEISGYITPADIGTPRVTNNQTEMLAMLNGLSFLPIDFCGEVLSDSAVTIGRVSQGWKWKNIPDWMHKIYQFQRLRLVNWEKITFTLLDGHPTKAQLEAGRGKRGSPVSIFNVMCDEECGKQAERFMKETERNYDKEQIKADFKESMDKFVDGEVLAKGAVIGVLEKACGGKENRYKVIEALTGKRSSKDLLEAEWYALLLFVQPHKPEGGKWGSRRGAELAEMCKVLMEG